MILALTAAVALAECDARTLAQAVGHAETAFTEMDGDRFGDAVRDARSTLECIADVLSPIEVAGYHRVNALAAFLRQDHTRATLEFRAVRGTQPGYVLPTEIAPEGHPLRTDYDASGQFAEGERFPLPDPTTGWLLVDGQRGTNAPGGRPFVLQWVNQDGVVALTAWVDVGSALPAYPKVPVAPPTPVPGPGPSTGRTVGAATWVGVGALVVGGGLYGAAFATRGRYFDAVDAGDRDAIASGHTTTNVLAGAGVTLLTGGALLTVVGAF